MPSTPPPAVTPSGIRDGDPAALAALVERRANAVLAYCEAVCPPDAAQRAAAEAFARFRAAIAATEDPRALDPEVLLLGATRHAAAELTAEPADAPAAGGLRGRLGRTRGVSADERAAVPGLLAARQQGVLTPEEAEHLDRLVAADPVSRVLADGVARAEAAFAAPPARTVPVAALTEILQALAAAAPITAEPGPELTFAAPAPPPDDPQDRVDPPSDGAGPVESLTGVATAEPVVATDTEPAPPEAAPAAEPPPEAPAAAAPEPEAAPAAEAPAPRRRGGVLLPRPPRRSDATVDPAARPGIVFRLVLPALVVGAAVAGALGVAGAFSAEPVARVPDAAGVRSATP